MDIEQELTDMLSYEVCLAYFEEHFPEVGEEEINKVFELSNKNAADALILYRLNLIRITT